jgi:hypothetical protein
MSGEYSIDTIEHETSQIIKKIMEQFGVDEKVALKIVAFANDFAIEKMGKWTKNLRRIRKGEIKNEYKMAEIL